MVPTENNAAAAQSDALSERREPVHVDAPGGQSVDGFLEAMPNGFAALGSDLRFSYVNAQAERLWGMQRQDMIGRTPSELFGGSRLDLEFRKAMDGVAAVEFELFEPSSQQWFFYKMSPALGAGLSVYFEDITTRRRAEGAAARLAAIVDSSDDAIISKDLDGIIKSWNTSAERMFGYTAAETVGQSIMLLIPPGRQDEETEILSRLKRGERVEHFETVRCRKDGSLLEVSLTISPVKDTQGNVVGASKIAHDITERRHAERDTLLLGAIVDSSDDAIISKTLDGIITSWNKSAERLFGYTSAEAVGESIMLLIPPDRLDEEPKIIERLGRGERVDHFETVRRRKDGSLIELSLTISPVKDSTGRVIGASKIARDITQRRIFERRLVEQAHLLDLTGDAILVRDKQDCILYWNRAAEDLYGFTREEALGRISHDLLRTEFPEPLPKILNILWQGGRWSGELSHASRSGSRLVTLSRWVAERDEKGDVIRILESNNDITERVRVQEELQRANTDLEQFAYSASHDLQEPLRTIKIYSELLTNQNFRSAEDDTTQYLGFMRSAATRMELLVRDVLAYTKISLLQAPAEEVDANKALADALGNLGGAIEQTNAQVTHDELPAVRMHAIHLQQLFQNLIGNSIKYRDTERCPIVHVTAERRNETWVFSVRDNGIGIAPQFKEQIFGLFTRLHNSNDYSGTGIGLAICQRIVERHHGRIWVESEPGRGSAFRFSIPV
jgi:PAS domain S-box-containing protein